MQKETNPKTGRPYTAYQARVKLAQDIQDTKPDRTTRTSPFEAFAYGTPEEKKAAQDFLAFEKRMGAQYQRPTEAEFRYSLYQRDPEGYKAVFGDKGATSDRAHATEMLKFFHKQRDAIQKDFMLGDDEKAQQLSEIDRLEGPFKEAAGVGGGGGNTGGDRVNVRAMEISRKPADQRVCSIHGACDDSRFVLLPGLGSRFDRAGTTEQQDRHRLFILSPVLHGLHLARQAA